MGLYNMDEEKIKDELNKHVEILSEHSSHLQSLQKSQERIFRRLDRIDSRINKLLWGIIVGQASIVGLLIRILVELLYHS